MGKFLYPVLDDLKHHGKFYEVSTAVGAKPPEVALTEAEAAPLLKLRVVGPAIGPAPDEPPPASEADPVEAALALLKERGFAVKPPKPEAGAAG